MNPRTPQFRSVMREMKALRALIIADDKVGALALLDDWNILPDPTPEELVAAAAKRVEAAQAELAKAEAEAAKSA